MCVVSAVEDSFFERWKQPYTTQTNIQFLSELTQDEIKSLKEFIEKDLPYFKMFVELARKYDEENNEPDCETEAKKQRILDLANELGIEIDFL